MKHKVTFPPTAGQFAGTHYFFSKLSRQRFLDKAIRLGYTEYTLS